MKKPFIGYIVERWKWQQQQLGQAVASFLDRGRPDFQSTTFGFICEDFDVEARDLIDEIEAIQTT